MAGSFCHVLVQVFTCGLQQWVTADAESYSPLLKIQSCPRFCLVSVDPRLEYSYSFFAYCRGSSISKISLFVSQASSNRATGNVTFELNDVLSFAPIGP